MVQARRPLRLLFGDGSSQHLSPFTAASRLNHGRHDAGWSLARQRGAPNLVN
jgi:hypothetical protein